MKINEVISALHDKRRSLLALNPNWKNEPDPVVYMNHGYWLECKREIQGEVCMSAYEFFHSDTIMGYNIWRVSPMMINGVETEHEPFLIVHTPTVDVST